MTSTSTFPTSKDSVPRTSPTDTLSGHSDLHDQIADAVEHLQDKVGIDSDTNVNSHDYKIAQLEGHDHNTVYYTETEVDTLLGNKQDSSTALTTSTTFGGDVSGTYNNIQVSSSGHNHDDRYYTESEINTKLTEATDSTVGLFKGIRGNGSYYVNGTGHATITFDNVGGTPTAAFVQTRAQVTTGAAGGEYVLSLPITNITATTITFRAYEVNVANSNDNSQVSTIYDTTPSDLYVNVSWLVIV